MNLKLENPRQLVALFAGFICLSFGIYLTMLSLKGLSSWGVFHDGFSNLADWLTFGIVTQIVGVVILTVSIVFLKTKIGMGTILNIIIVGPLIDLFEYIHPIPNEQNWVGYIILAIGILFTTFGRSLYISAKLGPGPRDGLFVGLTALTGIKVKYVKITIEFIVLLIGILLGGQSGIGTVIMIIASGYLVQYFFRILKYNPHESRNIEVIN